MTINVYTGYCLSVGGVVRIEDLLDAVAGAGGKIGQARPGSGGEGVGELHGVGAVGNRDERNRGRAADGDGVDPKDPRQGCSVRRAARGVRQGRFVMEPEIKVGDVVMLRSGGPRMTVIEHAPGCRIAKCAWFAKGATG